MKKIASSENIENFSQGDYIYIDKTEYIYNLIENNERVFISRPRRFGKSLTLNTIGTLFAKGVDPYFKGTFIYDKWKQDKYPVLHLNFLEYTTSDVTEFKRLLCTAIYRFARKQGIENVLEDKTPNGYIANLFDAMPDGQQIVLLIDEYDCQLSANINNPELYEQFRTCIREFYATLKGKKQIRFLAITGVTRLKDVSIFSVGSDIKDLSYRHAYSQMIGFTRDEIKHFYIDYLKLGVAYELHKEPGEVTDEEIENLLDRMAEQYDGYCFDELNMNKVFSTYSVNNFLQELSENRMLRFGDYWYEAGGVPSILKNYLESHKVNLEKFQNAEIDISYNSFMNPTTLPTMDENVLMCQTGYLTLKSAINFPKKVKLGTANREVSSALNALLTTKFFNPDSLASFYDGDDILAQGTVEKIVGHLNSVLSTIPYDQYPVESEAVLRSLLLMYLVGLKLDVRAEQHNCKGRSDLLINLKNRRVVIELKFSSDGKNSEALLQEAVKQIEDKEYGTENLGGRELIKIGCVFNGAAGKRQITLFKQV
ncbi:MAG: AAA family ATPase [Succinivibrio sp.]|nr:AAA family ATPase [Succinivibrio sp.]